MEQELEEQLSEAGRKLMDPPGITELLPLLDQIESCLSRVEQSPSKSMSQALGPSRTALVREELLRHSDTDVRVAVASCISEITRITAPDAPYDDAVMKEVFQMIVAAFENLSDIGSPSFPKRVSILETVAKVRSCVVMLDLECDELILDMFHHFINAIREDHSDSIFTAMETIMTLVLEESEEISSDISSFLLSSLRNDNKDVLPVARRLAEKVSSNCAAKLKTYLVETAQSMGTSLNDYSEVITSICQDSCENLEHNDVNASVHLADERKVSGHGQSVESPQVAEKPEYEVDVLGEVDTTSVKSPKSRMSNGTAKSEKEDTIAEPHSPKKKPERSRRNIQSKSTVAVAKAEQVNLDPQKIVVSEATPDHSGKRTRARKSDSLTHSTEISDHSREKETIEPSSRRRVRSKEAENSTHQGISGEETTFSSDLEKKANLSSPVESNNEAGSVPSPAPSQSLTDTGRRKRGRPGPKLSVKRRDKTQEAEMHVSPQEPKEILSGDGDKLLPSPDANSTKESEVNTISDAKRWKGSGKKFDSCNSLVTEAPAEEHQKEKPKERKGKAVAEKGVTGELTKNKITSPPTSTDKTSIKDKKHSERTPRTTSKRKSVSGKEVPGSSLDNCELGENLVGSNIKVWWPNDKMFYDGVVESFDPISKKHKILYTDGDEEKLLLKKEKWELINADTVPDKGAEVELPSPDDSTEKPPKKKAKTGSDSSTKQMRVETPLKKGGGSAGKSKGKTPKTGIKPEAETPKAGSKTKSNTSKASGKKSGSKVKSDTSKAATKSKSDTPKDESQATKLGRSTPKTHSKSKSETPKTGSKPDVGTSKTSHKTRADQGKASGESKVGTLKTDRKPKAETLKLGDKSESENAEANDDSKVDTPKTSSKSKVAAPKSSSKSNTVDSSGKEKTGAEKVREREPKRGKKRQRGAQG